MADTSIVFGILLAILGLYGFFTTHMSIHRLDSHRVGVILVILGAIARKGESPQTRHARGGRRRRVGLSRRGRTLLLRTLKGMDVTGTAGMSTATMAVLCAVFVALCVSRSWKRAAGARPMRARNGL